MTISSISIPTEFQPQARVLAEIDRWSAAEGVPFMVVGALARDLLVYGVRAGRPQRLTSDIDVAVAVSSWAELDRLTGHFDSPDRSPHRFQVLSTPVDIVPFDGVENQDRQISWPNDHRMSVFGFREAFGASVLVDLGVVSVRVASLAAQAVLKVEAWHDRHTIDRKDATDLLEILRAASAGPYADAVFAREDLLARYDFDPELAGAHLLGAEGRSLLGAGSPGVSHVRTMFGRQISDAGLLPAHMSAQVDRNRQLLVALRAGLSAES